jgi:hypothetical protein
MAVLRATLTVVVLAILITGGPGCQGKASVGPPGQGSMGGEGGVSPPTGGAGGSVKPPPADPIDARAPEAGSGGAAASGGSGGAPAMDAAAGPLKDAASAADTGAPPPPSGVQISIGGTMVAREKAVVFIHVGHSDMLGRANGPAALRPFFYDTDPHLWTYRKGGAFAPAKEPTAGSTPSAGPGMALLKTALGLAPDAHFISIGHGHSGADGGHCANFRKGKSLYGTVMDHAIELKGKVTFGGIFTMFGITEYRNGSAGLNGIADCLVGLAADIRGDLGEPQLPLMVGDWNQDGTGIYSPTGENGMIVRPLIQMVPGRDPRAAVIPTTGLPMEDDRHLNMAGHKMWAERGLKILTDKGWAPWAVRQP